MVCSEGETERKDYLVVVKNDVKRDFAPFEDVVVRTPLFPLKNVAKSASEAISSELFRTAIYLSSPSFERLLADGCLSDKIKSSVLKYLYRASARCTPFGIFSGYSTGKVSGETTVQLSGKENWICHTGLDSQVFHELASTLLKDPAIRRQLKYYPNTSIYLIANRYHYTKRGAGKDYWAHVSAASNTAIECILEIAKNGAYIEEILKSIHEQDGDLPEEEILRFINKLIDAQILVSQLDPSPLNLGLTSTFKDIARDFADNDIKSQITALCDTVDAINGESPNNIAGKLREASDLARSLSSAPRESTIKIDLEKPAQVSVSKADVGELRRFLLFMSRINQRQENPEMKRFISTFESRYEGCSVPMLEALDKSYGIGYPVEEAEIDLHSPLLSDVRLPRMGVKEETVRCNKVDSIMFNKYSRCLSENKDTITLSDDDFRGVDFQATFSKTVSVFCSFLKDGRIYVKAAGGSSAINLLNRFSQQGTAISSIVKKIAEYEDSVAAQDGSLIADVLFSPERNDGNLVIQSQNRFSVPYMSGYSESGNNLTLSDVVMSMDHGKLVLTDSIGNRVIHPRLSNSYNYLRSKLPVMRFLDAYQHYDVTDSLLWHWNTLMLCADYLPRVQYGRCIISKRRWRIDSNLFKKVSKEEFFSSFAKLRKERNIPGTGYLQEMDSELYLNFTKEDDLELLKRHFDTHSHAIIEEDLYEGENSIAEGDDGVYANEVIVSFKQV